MQKLRDRLRLACADCASLHTASTLVPAPSTLPEERDKPGMDEKKREELGASKATPHTSDIDVAHKL